MHSGGLLVDVLSLSGKISDETTLLKRGATMLRSLNNSLLVLEQYAT